MFSVMANNYASWELPIMILVELLFQNPNLPIFNGYSPLDYSRTPLKGHLWTLCYAQNMLSQVPKVSTIEGIHCILISSIYYFATPSETLLLTNFSYDISSPISSPTPSINSDGIEGLPIQDYIFRRISRSGAMGG